ncbi:MAG: hypothetical protein WC209_09340 [Ignavibacteriaceae bacterium]|jgi:hypothetical protein
MINGFIIHKNAQLQEKVRWLEIKLEAFIRERKEKTIDLAHGTLKLHKKPDKVEISDMELFIKHAKPEMLTVIPESVKPDLNKVKAFIKQRAIPKVVTVTEGKEEFTYKLRKEENENGEEEIRTPTQHTFIHQIAL